MAQDPQSQQQEQQKQQQQYRQYRPTKTTPGKNCFHCGAPISITAEICPHCGKPTNPNICTFCGSPMDPSDRFCPECGNSREGIICPECGTLNFRSFCRKCNHPLDHMAQQAIAEAKADPKYQRMCELQQRMVELERRILESADLADEEGVEEVELSEEDQALVSEYEELLAMIQNGVAEAPQSQEEKKPETPKPETPKPEAPKRPKMKIQIEQMREIVQEYKQNVAEMNGIMEDLAPDPGATPQMQRNYFCARKLPVITVTRHKEKIQKPVEWICNYCGCHHHEPSECAEPWHGGIWVYENIEIDEVITTKNWQVDD